MQTATLTVTFEDGSTRTFELKKPNINKVRNRETGSAFLTVKAEILSDEKTPAK